MKFVHIADSHLDTQFKMLSDKNGIGDRRRYDQRMAFRKIINYIKDNDIKYFFIAGDLYEHESIRRLTIDYINDLFKEIKDTLIFIAPGNHDPFLKNSYYNNYEWSENVHIFGPKFEKVETDEADIYGYGFDNFSCSNLEYDKLKIENPEKLNILIIHGTLDGATTEEMKYNSLSKKMLEKKGFDYVALGHIHKNNFSKDGKIIYPGSTIAMGFDELGEHGMVTGEIQKNKNKLKYIKIDNTEFVKYELDCSKIFSIEELIEKINTLYLDENNLYEIILIGKRNFEINVLNLYKYNLNEKIIKIKNKTKINYNIEEISQENNLKGLFAKEILEEKNNYSEEILEKSFEIVMEIMNK